MKDSLKILVLNWRDPLHPEAGGAEVHLDQILSYLSPKHDITLVSTRISPKEEHFEYHGYQVHRVGHPHLFNFHFKRLWNKRYKKENYDLIIDDISKIGLQTPLYIKDIPILAIFHHIHGHTLFQLLPYPVALYVSLMERFALKSYLNTPMIVVSNSSKEELLSLAPFKNLTVIPNGINPSYLKIKNPTKIPYTICSIGRLTYAKRVDLSIIAFAKVLKTFPDACFLIAGKGDDQKRLEELVYQLDLEDSVYFLDYITEEEKVILLESSEAMLFTSEKEGWGITVIEASAHFTPVFAFDVQGIRDSISQGVNGYLVTPFGDTDKLADRLIQYLDDPLQISLQASSYCHAKNYDYQKIAQEFELFCYNLIP